VKLGYDDGHVEEKKKRDENNSTKRITKNEAEEDKRRDGRTRCNKISSSSNSTLTPLRTELNGAGEQLVWLTPLQRD